MHEQPTSCLTFDAMSLCKVRSFRRKKIVLWQESCNGVVLHYATWTFLSGSTLSTTGIFFSVSFITWHYVKYTVSKEKRLYFVQRPTIVKRLPYTMWNFASSSTLSNKILHNVLLFLNLVLDFYYIHNLHTYTKYRKKMVKRRYKRGRSLGIFRSITIYFHNWKHHSIGYHPKPSRLLVTWPGINKTPLISFIKHGTQQRS